MGLLCTALTPNIHTLKVTLIIHTLLDLLQCGEETGELPWSLSVWWIFRCHMHQLRELSWLLLCTARLPRLHSTLSPDAVKAILARLSRSTAKTAPRWPSNLRTRAQWRMSHMIACRVVGWQWGICGSDYYVDSFDIKLMFHQSEGSAVGSHLCKLSYPNLHLSNPLK